MKRIKKPNKHLILYSLLAISVALVILLFSRTTYLKRQLNLAEKKSITRYEDIEDAPILNKYLIIDKLLAEEEYGKALLAYEKLLNLLPKDSKLHQTVQLRMRDLRKLLVVTEQLSAFVSADSLDETSQKTSQVDSLAARFQTSTQIRGDQMDSLYFALEKAKVLAESLRRQLKNKLASDYLNFANEEGTNVHYVGHVKGKKANGHGVGLYSNGGRYDGAWKNNQHHGLGTYYWPDGEYYEGTFQYGVRSGQGSYFWPNGEKFSGVWENDKRNGLGIFYGKDGKVVAKGLWQNNKFVKKSK